jgi:hypothetical protein
MRDFEAYYSAGQTANDGRDPYGTAIWTYERTIPGVDATRYELLPFVSPPATLLVWRALAHLPYRAALLLWSFVLIASAFALVAIAGSLCRLPLRRPLPLLLAAVTAVGFGPITSDVALGQIALPAFVCALLSCVAVSRSIPIAGAFGALGFAQPNVGLAIAANLRERRGLFAAIVAVVLAAIATLLAVGISGAFHYLTVLREHGAAERFSAIQITPASVFYGLGANEAAAQILGTLVALAAAALLVLCLIRFRSRATRIAQTCALLPLAMPFFHEHDLLVTYVPAIFYAMRLRIALWPLAVCGALLCGIDWLGLAQRPDGLLQALSLSAALLLALYTLRLDVRPAQLAAPLAVLLLLIVCAVVAHGAPAPIWPDAMHGNVATNLSSAATWNDEQRATGLLDRNAFWALLRAASLCGCLVLALAGIASSKGPAGSRKSSRVPAAVR